jgi:hypothetical protein
MKMYDATNLSECDFTEIIMTEPTPKMKKRAAAKKGETKPNDGGKIQSKTPEWYDLYQVMQNAGSSLLKSLMLRDDIPADAKSILECVMCLRESKELFFAEGGSLTPYSALFWTDELKKWAEANSAATS